MDVEAIIARGHEAISSQDPTMLAQAQRDLFDLHARLVAQSDRNPMVEGAVLEVAAQVAFERQEYREAADAYEAAAWAYPDDLADALARVRFFEGVSLLRVAEQRPGITDLKKAITAFKATLANIDSDAMPDQWAAAQSNFGLAHLMVEVPQSALNIFAREHHPVSWGHAQINLGATLATLGLRTAGGFGLHYLRQAIQHFEAAKAVVTEQEMPSEWALIEENLTQAHRALEERQRALQELQRALQERRRVGQLIGIYAMTNVSSGVDLETPIQFYTVGNRRPTPLPPKPKPEDDGNE